MNNTKYKWFGLILLLVLVGYSMPNYAQQVASNKATSAEPLSLTDQLKSIKDEVNPAAWKIRNGCVTLKRIKRIRFLDDQTALMSMRGKKKIILRLKRECPGIKRSGYVHHTVGHRLCAGFDRFSVLGSGFSCRIDSLEPYVNIEEPQSEIDLD